MKEGWGVALLSVPCKTFLLVWGFATANSSARIRNAVVCPKIPKHKGTHSFSFFPSRNDIDIYICIFCANPYIYTQEVFINYTINWKYKSFLYINIFKYDKKIFSLNRIISPLILTLSWMVKIISYFTYFNVFLLSIFLFYNLLIHWLFPLFLSPYLLRV